MSNRNKLNLPDALRLNWPNDTPLARRVVRLVAYPIFLVVLVLIGLIIVALFAALLGLNEYTGTETQSAAIRNIGLFLAAIIGIPFIVWRSIVAQKQVDVAEQGHITDRINKAVEGLGAEKTVKRQRLDDNGLPAFVVADGNPDASQPIMEEVTRPNLEVRIGAIYALERIAQDSDRDHVQIMEILCAYIRENAPASSAVDWPEIEMKDGEADGPLEEDWEERLAAFRVAQVRKNAEVTCRTDILVALEVIGRRSAEQRLLEARAGHGKPGDAFVFDNPDPDPDRALDENGHDPDALKAYLTQLSGWRDSLSGYQGFRLDLRNTNLQGADLSRLNLNGALLNGARLQGAGLGGARLQGVDLEGARLQGAFLGDARLQGAFLGGARLQGAGLRGARLQGAFLGDARLQGAFLGEARLQGAGLGGARLQGAFLGDARLQGADLECARLQGAFLRVARLQGANLGFARLQGAFLGDARLQGVFLRGARLQGAHLWGARFDEHTDLAAASFQGAAARSVDFTNLPGFEEHLTGMFGDGSVILPGGHGPEYEDWPSHWPKFGLDDEFEEEWRKWQADAEGYVPPDQPVHGG